MKFSFFVRMFNFLTTSIQTIKTLAIDITKLSLNKKIFTLLKTVTVFFLTLGFLASAKYFFYALNFGRYLFILILAVFALAHLVAKLVGLETLAVEFLAF